MPRRRSASAFVAVMLGCAGVARNPPEEPAGRLSGAPPSGDMVPAELTTVGWDALTQTPVVLLRTLDSGQVVPIWIGLAEARAIGSALHGVEPPRPMTHDLIAHLLTTLEAELEEVDVHDVRDGTYYGVLKLRLAGEEAPRWVDTRPSDGLALALRTGAKIRVARKIVDELPAYDFLAPERLEQVVRSVGLTVVAVSDALRRQYALPPERGGVVVIAVEGEAERQGMRRGDLIVAIGGAPAGEPLDLLEALRRTEPGGHLEVTYWRDGQETTVALAVGPAEKPAERPDRVA